MANLDKVGKLRLTNNNEFMVKMDFVYLIQNRKKRVPGSRKDILLGQSETRDLGEFGIPDGATVTIHADAKGGMGRVGAVWFEYERGHPRVANFMIGGTEPDNELGFTGIT